MAPFPPLTTIVIVTTGMSMSDVARAIELLERPLPETEWIPWISSNSLELPRLPAKKEPLAKPWHRSRTQQWKQNQRRSR